MLGGGGFPSFHWGLSSPVGQGSGFMEREGAFWASDIYSSAIPILIYERDYQLLRSPTEIQEEGQGSRPGSVASRRILCCFQTRPAFRHCRSNIAYYVGLLPLCGVRKSAEGNTFSKYRGSDDTCVMGQRTMVPRGGTTGRWG